MKKDKKKINHSLVGIIMGSKSDWGTMKHCSDTLKNFKIRHDVRVISAHRTPQRLHKYLKERKKKSMTILIDMNFLLVVTWESLQNILKK
mgnify:CR=1 FL=1